MKLLVDDEEAAPFVAGERKVASPRASAIRASAKFISQPPPQIVRCSLWMSLAVALFFFFLPPPPSPSTSSASSSSPPITADNYVYPDRLPQIAWLLSFGGSGTSYTVLNTEFLTQTTTASNYGSGYKPCLPVHPNATDGPFIHASSLSLPLPESYILTKSHCGGFCIDCPPRSYDYAHNATDFGLACASGKRRLDNGTVLHVTYDDEDEDDDGRPVIAKAVHMIRNPFDNLVARMHLAVSNKRDRGENVDALAFETSPAGVLEWCDYLDQRHAVAEARDLPELSTRYAHVPCHAEWFRYVQWHNMVLEVTRRKRKKKKQLPVHYIWYDNYTNDWEGTVRGLTDFLEVPHRGEPYAWRAHTEYELDPTMRRQAGAMMAELASPALWDLIRHYIEPYLNNDEGSGVEEDSPSDPSDPALDDEIAAFFSHNVTLGDSASSQVDDDVIDSQDAPAKSESSSSTTMPEAESAAKTKHPRSSVSSDNPQIAWLLSFPNSGSEYTLENVEHMTGTSTASNYASRFETAVSVRPELEDGPFLKETSLTLSDYVLTDSHCAGFCDACGPAQYVRTAANFTLECLRAEKPISVMEFVDTYYEPSVPQKAVHLIRSPFDNIVERMYLSPKMIKKLGWNKHQVSTFQNSEDGFNAWCEFNDHAFAEEERDFFSQDILELFDGLPCHAEWYRFVQWHNHAHSMTDRLGIPVHHVYYEDYATNLEDSVAKLFDFLELKTIQKSPLQHLPGQTFRTYYEVADVRKAITLVEGLATPEVWKLLRPYFKKWL